MIALKRTITSERSESAQSRADGDGVRSREQVLAKFLIFWRGSMGELGDSCSIQALREDMGIMNKIL